MSRLTERMEEALRAAGRRVTTQRRLVLRVLAEASGHPDAVALHDLVRARDPTVSLATVYRTLSLLKEVGLVEEQCLGRERGHYETLHNDPHYHFTCVQCGKVIEFDTPLVVGIERELREREGVEITRTRLHLSGYCAQCSGAAH